MFGTVVEQLESAIDEVAALVASAEDEQVSRDEALAALLTFERLGERLQASIGGFATDLEARDAHRPDLATSMANWLAARTGQARNTVGSRLHLARKLRSMSETSAALAAGAITHCHAHVLSRALNPCTVDAFARDEAMLVGSAKQKANREADPTDPGLDHLPSQRRARALGELCARAAASPENPARRKPLLVLHTTLSTLTESGNPADWMLALEQAWSSAIPLDVVHLWSCDCWLADVVTARTASCSTPAGRSASPTGPCAELWSPATATAAPSPVATAPSAGATPTTSSGGATAA